MTTGIAGSGRVAQALGRRLCEAGEGVDWVASRSLEHAQEAARFIGGGCRAAQLRDLDCERVLIAVSDRAIVEVARSLPRVRILLHTCGAHGGELLRGVASAGASCGSVHPFQTLASPESGYQALAGSAFAVDGDAAAVAWAERIVGACGGEILRIPAEARAIYHAAAAMASNHVIATIDGAAELLRRAGVEREAALRAIGPMARTALANALEHGPAGALTGPVERGDRDTVARHLDAVAGSSRSLQGLYRAASLQALDLAVRRGMDAGRAAAMKSLLLRAS